MANSMSAGIRSRTSQVVVLAAVSAASVLVPRVGVAQVATGNAAPPAVEVAPPSISGWPVAEVEAAQARCAQMLRGQDIVAKPLPPLKEHECGTPAPFELISVGRSPQVSFFPTVTVTCDMALALSRWVKSDLQPLARKHLGADIVRIDTMSSYSCRTAYGRKNARLSEHGRANAVDVRSFTTAKGATSEVLADWGMTGHEIAAQVAAAKKLDIERSAVAARSQPSTATVATGSLPRAEPGGTATTLAVPTITLGTRGGPSLGLPMPSPSDTAIGLSSGINRPARLGGPKPDASMVTGEGSVGAKTDFLRAAHDAACRQFGTVLGPEANAAHRNHFHVDMAERRSKAICE